MSVCVSQAMLEVKSICFIQNLATLFVLKLAQPWFVTAKWLPCIFSCLFYLTLGSWAMCWLFALFIFATLDTNEGEVEGEDFREGFEEDQGQANQGKPSLDLWMLNHILWLLCYSCLSIYFVWYLLMLMERAHHEHVGFSLTPHLPSPLGKWWSLSWSWCTL